MQHLFFFHEGRVLTHAYVALYVRYGELKKAQRMSRPAVKGNVSCAGEGAITATQRDCDEWTDEAS